MKRKYIAVIEAPKEGIPVRKITIEVEAETMDLARYEIESEFPTFENANGWRWLKLEEVK